MKKQYLRVLGISWEEPIAQHYSVEFLTETGQRFECFSDGNRFQAGKIVCIEYFYWNVWDDTDIQLLLQKNPQREKKLVHRDHWNYDAFGQIVDIDEEDTVIDCGGVLIPYSKLTSDHENIGKWVGFRIERLELEVCGI